jgi:hypothetical protein
MKGKMKVGTKVRGMGRRRDKIFTIHEYPHKRNDQKVLLQRHDAITGEPMEEYVEGNINKYEVIPGQKQVMGTAPKELQKRHKREKELQELHKLEKELEREKVMARKAENKLAEARTVTATKAKKLSVLHAEKEEREAREAREAIAINDAREICIDSVKGILNVKRLELEKYLDMARAEHDESIELTRRIIDQLERKKRASPLMSPGANKTKVEADKSGSEIIVNYCIEFLKKLVHQRKLTWDQADAIYGTLPNTTHWRRLLPPQKTFLLSVMNDLWDHITTPLKSKRQSGIDRVTKAGDLSVRLFHGPRNLGDYVGSLPQDPPPGMGREGSGPHLTSLAKEVDEEALMPGPKNIPPPTPYKPQEPEPDFSSPTPYEPGPNLLSVAASTRESMDALKERRLRLDRQLEQSRKRR